MRICCVTFDISLIECENKLQVQFAPPFSTEFICLFDLPQPHLVLNNIWNGNASSFAQRKRYKNCPNCHRRKRIGEIKWNIIVFIPISQQMHSLSVQSKNSAIFSQIHKLVEAQNSIWNNWNTYLPTYIFLRPLRPFPSPPFRMHRTMLLVHIFSSCDTSEQTFISLLTDRSNSTNAIWCYATGIQLCSRCATHVCQLSRAKNWYRYR